MRGLVFALLLVVFAIYLPTCLRECDRQSEITGCIFICAGNAGTRVKNCTCEPYDGGASP